MAFRFQKKIDFDSPLISFGFRADSQKNDRIFHFI